MRRHLTTTMAAWLALAGSLSWCRGAHAQWALGADGGGTQASASDDWGGAVDGRFGFRFGLPREFIIHTIICQPEVIVGYRSMPWASTHVARFGGGGRLGLLVYGLEIFAFGHFSGADAAGSASYLGDVGAALDYRLQTWSFGYHYAREVLHAHGVENAFDNFGLHVEIRGYWL
jgi:hypothetical protein